MDKAVSDNSLIIRNGTKAEILLVGNGINRAFSEKSWEEIIQECAKNNNVSYDKDIYNKMPYNMQIVVATGDNVDKSMKKLCDSMRQIPVIDEQKAFIGKLLDLPFTHILTSNYTYEIEKTVKECKRYNIVKTDKNGRAVNDMMLHRPIVMKYGNSERYIWHIHGHVGAANSIVMGHYYYGKLLGRIQKYVPSFLKRYNGCCKYEKNCSVQSWVDLFMTGNVHILGLGMDFTENDLWWLVCCKKRHFPESRIYFYEPAENIDLDKRRMMECYNIYIPELHVYNNNYIDFYHSAIELIQKNLTGGDTNNIR
ncbi:MAG: hypothetical protein J6A37_15805 [Oscillospiraceae bacterium]|nr:hypothetical protein [Oscillospiraceae bacterium]